MVWYNINVRFIVSNFSAKTRVIVEPTSVVVQRAHIIYCFDDANSNCAARRVVVAAADPFSRTTTIHRGLPVVEAPLGLD